MVGRRTNINEYQRLVHAGRFRAWDGDINGSAFKPAVLEFRSGRMSGTTQKLVYDHGVLAANIALQLTRCNPMDAPREGLLPIIVCPA
jgi:hypothetical protein